MSLCKMSSEKKITKKKPISGFRMKGDPKSGHPLGEIRKLLAKKSGQIRKPIFSRIYRRGMTQSDVTESREHEFKVFRS